MCFFPFDVSDGRCGTFVSIPDRCFPFYYSTDRSKAIVPMLVLLFVALWFILRGDLFLSLVWCYIDLVFYGPLSIAITSLGEERANLSAFRTVFDLRVIQNHRLVCLFSLPLGVFEGLGLAIVAIPGLFSYLHFHL